MHITAIAALVITVPGILARDQILAPFGHHTVGIPGRHGDHRHRQGAIGDRGIDIAPLAAALGIVERREHTHHGAQGSARQIGELEIGIRWRSAPVADLIGQPGIGGVVHIVPGAVAIRPGLPEAGEGAIDQGRIERPQRLRPQAQGGHGAGTEAFDQHLGIGHQTMDQVAALGAAKIDLQGAFVAVEDMKAGGIFAILGPDAPDIVAEPGILHLDHISAQIAEKHGAQGSRQQPGEIQHPDAVKWGPAHDYSPPRSRRCGLPDAGPWL